MSDEATSGVEAVLDLYREAVRIDVKMEGPKFMGCNSSALKRAWEADRAHGEIMDELDHAYRLEQETPEGGAVITSAELIRRCGGDPTAPFEVGPFPPEMRQTPALATPAAASPPALAARPTEAWRDLDNARLQRAIDAFYEPCEGTTIDGIRNAILAWEQG